MLRYQQGDVCLESCKVPLAARKLNTLVIREGETTGHKHVVVCDHGEAELLREERGDLYVRVSSGTVTLTHEEHGPIVLPVGEYHILPGVYEYDYEAEEAKRVTD